MCFHPAKCQVIRFTREKPLAAPPTCSVLYDETVPSVKTINYLGVHIQHGLRWAIHVDFMCGKVVTALYFIKRTLSHEIHESSSKGLQTAAATCAWVGFVRLRPATGAMSSRSTKGLLNKRGLKPLAERRARRRVCFFRPMRCHWVNIDLTSYIQQSSSVRRHD